MNRNSALVTMPRSQTVAGICTKEVDDPGSTVFIPGKLKQEDRQFFQGDVSECREHQTTEEQLNSIRCNWTVKPEPLYSKNWNRTYPNVVDWYQGDNGDLLGRFSDRRHIVNPVDIVDWYKDFINQAHGWAHMQDITLDVVGWLPQQKVFYVASKLTDMNPGHLKNVGDTTDFFLMFHVNYAKAQSMKATIWANELVCTNGMTRKIQDGSARVNHRSERGAYDIHQALTAATDESKRWIEHKESMINTRCEIRQGKQIIRSFFRKEIEAAEEASAIRNVDLPVSNNKVQEIERIYAAPSVLKGGNLYTRTDTLFRVHSAWTQWTNTIKRVKNGEHARFAQQLDGEIAKQTDKFTDFLLTNFTSDQTIPH